MLYFDANVCYGPKQVFAPNSGYDLNYTIKLLERSGIEKALVTSTLQSEYHPAYANKMLQEDIAEHNGLYPVWALLPHHTGEFPPPSELRKQIKKNRIRAVKIFPLFKHHNFPIDEFCCGGLFTMLEEAKLPVLIDLDQLNWNQLDTMCENHKSLRVVLSNLNYSVDRALFPLLERHQNIYVETSGYKQFRGIEFFVRRFGAARMVFGSGLPYMSFEAAVSVINYADINETDKARIIGQNLDSLIREVTW